MTKPKYGVHSESAFPWQERTYENKSIVNRSSVTHNIISHEDNRHSGFMQVSGQNKKVLFRKKALCEYQDISRPIAFHPNPDYNNEYKEN